MRTRRAAAVPAKLEPATPTSASGLRIIRWAVSICVVLHFTAILAAAASVGPTSGLIIAVWRMFRPYLLVLYLNQGYNFFAPEPTPSTLLKFEAKARNGNVLKRGQIPDPSLQPRLLYHRHLLLTEHIAIAAPDFRTAWFNSYARHLCHKYRAASVHLIYIVHYHPLMESVRDGVELDDSTSYSETDLGEFSCGDR